MVSVNPGGPLISADTLMVYLEQGAVILAVATPVLSIKVQVMPVAVVSATTTQFVSVALTYQNIQSIAGFARLLPSQHTCTLWQCSIGLLSLLKKTMQKCSTASSAVFATGGLPETYQ